MHFDKIQNQPINLPWLKNVTIDIKREDLIHPIVSGNKYRKLRYNMDYICQHQLKGIYTFGGVHSNHIAAVAATANEQGVKSLGIIRGDEHRDKILEIPTLAYASRQGMDFRFTTREEYKQRENTNYINQLKQEMGANWYYLPEGGSNALGVKGCEEILMPQDAQYDYICCAVGTGGTLAGIVRKSNANQKVLGFSALKKGYLTDNINAMIPQEKFNWELFDEDYFGGYAKINKMLVYFLNDFYRQTQIPLDPIYTGKLVFRVLELYKKNYFRHGSRILLIHTGGLQGLLGMNQRLKLKNKEIIIYEK